MLFVVFRLGADRYAIAADRVVEVLPPVELKALPGMPRGVAGLCNYRGQPVPVIDVTALALGHPAPRRWGTRLLVVRYPDGDAGGRLLGLIVEEATQVMRWGEAQFTDTGMRNDGAPFLGPVTTTTSGLVQRVEVGSLLSSDVRQALFAAAQEALP